MKQWVNSASRLILALVIIVLVLAALILAAKLGSRPTRPRIVLGAAEPARSPRARASAELRRPGAASPLSRALADFARGLGPDDAMTPHPLDSDRYEGPRGRHGGGRARAAGSRPWHAFPTWKALRGDRAAEAAFLADRAEVLRSPSLDWSGVLEALAPRLREPREYIGLINLAPDGQTLVLADLEASPVDAAASRTETCFAGIPGALVEKFARRPALFLCHTHPDDPACNPLPSSHDLSTAIAFGAETMFAANVIVSAYGVLVYGLDWSAYRAINAARDPPLALLNLSHDVVAAHEAVRSWAPYSLAEYLEFYPRHRLFCYAYPSARMVADQRTRTFTGSLEAPIDLELIAGHGRDLARYLRTGKARACGPSLDAEKAPARGGAVPPPPRTLERADAPCPCADEAEGLPPFFELPTADHGLD